MREQRVSTPDGRFWYVRRRWARRQLPGRRRKLYELSPAEREAVRVLPDTDDVADWYVRSFGYEAGWIYLAVGLVVLGAVGGAVLIVERVVPFLVDNALAPGGRFFCLDTLWDAIAVHATGPVVTRQLDDGREFRIVKVLHRPDELQARLRELGWDADVQALDDEFYCAVGSRRFD